MFVISVHKQDGSVTHIDYDPTRGIFRPDDGRMPVLDTSLEELYVQAAGRFHSAGDVPGKARRCVELRIFLGYACNMSCSYCIQSPCEHNSLHTDDFMLDRLCDAIAWYRRKFPAEDYMNINFMGGEPLLHWDDMVRIMDNLRPRIPGISFSIITNGTLMDGARANYILKHDNIVVSVSHDGPGQYLRGKDPLAPRSESYAAIMHILNRAPQRINFNPVLTRPNHRADHIMRYLEERLHNPICLSEAMPCKLTGMEQALRFGMSGDTLTDMQEGIMNLMFGTHLERVQTWMEIFCLLVDVTLKGHPLPPHGRCMAFYGLHYGIDLNGDVHRWTSCEGECFPGTDGRNIAGKLIDWWKDNASLEEIGTCLADGARLPNHLTRPECRRCPFVVGCSGGCPSMREEFFSLSCAQERAFLQAIFAAFLKTLYPDMSGFDCRYIEEKEKER